MSYWLVFPIIIFTGFVLTELIRRYTLSNNFVDIPNDRSSHTVPTPRGGGLSIVVIFLIAINFIDNLSNNIFVALLGSGLIVAVIGFWDDCRHIPAKWRLLAHFTASFWVLYWIGNFIEIQIFNYDVNLGFFGVCLVAFVLVWLLNLFNFMDGIDGIAASEAIFVFIAGAFFSWSNAHESMVLIQLILAASVTGFLFLNWPPAKVFMGDVGSSFLGFIIGVIVYINIQEGVSIWIWFVLLGVFLVDSGITLIRRILNRERWYEAHCSHAYQHAAKRWGHEMVTSVTIVINLCWLFPIAYMAYLYQNVALLLVFVAYVPLVFLALKFNAGLVANN